VPTPSLAPANLARPFGQSVTAVDVQRFVIEPMSMSASLGNHPTSRTAGVIPAGMLRLSHHKQVARIVVRFVPVDVVDDLVRLESPSKHLLSDEPIAVDVAALLCVRMVWPVY
jgi:hypothetical protein